MFGVGVGYPADEDDAEFTICPVGCLASPTGLDGSSSSDEYKGDSGAVLDRLEKMLERRVMETTESALFRGFLYSSSFSASCREIRNKMS